MSPIAIVAAILGSATALVTLVGTAVSLGRILARLEHLSEQVARLESTGTAVHEMRQAIALLTQRLTTVEAASAGHDRSIRAIERHTPDPEAS